MLKSETMSCTNGTGSNVQCYALKDGYKIKKHK